MKNKLKKCENCKEEEVHSVKKVMSSAKIKLRRSVERCNECGSTTIKNARKGTYTKKQGGLS